MGMRGPARAHIRPPADAQHPFARPMLRPHAPLGAPAQLAHGVRGDTGPTPATPDNAPARGAASAGSACHAPPPGSGGAGWSPPFVPSAASLLAAPTAPPSHGGSWDGQGFLGGGGPAPLCDIPSGRCFFTGPWTVTRSSLRMLRRVAAFCRPLRPVLLLVSFPRSQSPVVGVLGLCWLRRGGGGRLTVFSAHAPPLCGRPSPPPSLVVLSFERRRRR